MTDLIHLFLASLFIIFFGVVMWYCSRKPHIKNINEALEENAFWLSFAQDHNDRAKLLRERDFLLRLLDDKK